MATFCLVKPLADKFKQAIKSGEIDIDKLSSMSSEERNAFFTERLGARNAKETNAMFESKLLLKNQKVGLVNWAKQITGMKPEVKNTLIDKINKMENILSPENEKDFLQALASKRLGTDISIEEANKIVELSKKIKSLENFTNDKDRVKLGRAKIDLVEYVNSLNPQKANILTNIANVPHAALTSFDLSAPLNQGWGMLSRKQFYKNIGSMLKAAKNESYFKDIQADILTRPTYKSAKKAGLRITDLSNKLENREEVFMTNLLDKVPGVRASQRAYTGFLNKLRMDVYDDLVKKAEIAGEDIGVGSKVLEDIAKVVNNFTGGARVGKLESSTQFLNATFFSPRKIASTLNILNPVNYINPKISPTARKAALRNLVGSLAITTTIVNLAKTIAPDDIRIETDPNSSDFGKLIVGDTRLDISGGNANYITLFSRILSGKTKSTTTGITKKIGEGYNAKTSFDVATDFLRNKLSPNVSLMVDILSGENSIGEKKTISQSVIDRFKPMLLKSIYELSKSDTKFKIILGGLATFGAGLQTYKFSEDWSEKTSSEMKQFKDKIGEDNFKKANENYNNKINESLKILRKDENYLKMDDEKKSDKIEKIKDDLKKEIFKQYQFKSKRLPTKK